MALYRSPLIVTLWPSSFLKKYGPMIPPAHKAHQTVKCVVSHPLGAGNPTPSPFDLSASDCHRLGLDLQTAVSGKCSSSPEDEQEKQGQIKKDFTPCTKDPDTVLIKVESMIESTTDSNKFRSKDGTVIRIPDANFNNTSRSVTKYTSPCSTRIRTTTVSVNNQGLIGYVIYDFKKNMGARATPLSVKGDIEDGYSELDNGG
ncbi:hypothetical protein TNCV_2569691 [Trichonephila clavipes]|nr:hypothetical protein TNCV_2569691 [Trichonephila clavipes]